MRTDSESAGTTVVPGIDVVTVSRWIADRAAMTPPLSLQPIPGGRSNPTYPVRDAHREMIILRRPPLRQLLATGHNVGREFATDPRLEAWRRYSLSEV
jgi:aminoglycoside phosphotransferase (APT) family kinase protein